MQEPSTIADWSRISILGSGGFGIVTLWQHKRTFEYIALKKCKFQLSNHMTARQRQRWVNEVTIMKQLSHPNIVAYRALPIELEAGLRGSNPTGLPLLPMEYCRRGNLRHVLSQAGHATGLAEADVRRVLADLARGLAYLHKLNVTHRDIKPENVVCQPAGGDGAVVYKIIDLGYAKELSDATVSFVGTLHYLAPEIMKSVNYNYSVDYWSLGVVAFEVVCGQLPFLPQFTPFERLDYIQNKKPDHICIYQAQSGSVQYSSEIMKQNHISSVLKLNLEVWLRHVFNLDSTARSLPISNDTNVFQYLLNVLNKKITNVFSVYTLEFYSYEINDSTSIATLKTWIMRDTNIQINEQILLVKGFESEPELVVDFVKNDLTIFVFKIDAFLQRNTFSLPQNVIKLLDNVDKEYRWARIRPFYLRSLYYLVEERKLVRHLGDGLKLLLNYMQTLNVRLRVKVQETYKATSDLLLKANCYFNLHDRDFTDFILPNSKLFYECINAFRELTERLPKVTERTNDLVLKYEISLQRKAVLDQLLVKIEPILQEGDISDLITDCTVLLAKGCESSSQQIRLSIIAKIISAAIRKKNHLFKNKQLDNYSKGTAKAVKDCIDLLNWIDSHKAHIAALSNEIDSNQRTQQSLLYATFKRKTQCEYNGKFETEVLLEQNQKIRCQLEEMLTKIVVDLKTLCHDDL